MAVSLTVLGSGSQGNCSVVSTSRTRILVDAGFSARETFRRMQVANEDPHAITALLISHEHNDHVYGLYGLARRLKVPVFLTGAAYQEWRRFARKKYADGGALPRIEHFDAGRSFIIGDITVVPFTVPHDAVDPVGFTFRGEGMKLGLVTDLGYIPPSVGDHLRGCDVLMIESNHDLEMLRTGPYPWAVKQRVMSRVGHLSNDALADFLLSDYDGGAAFVVLAHLSEHNNHPEIARKAAEQALGQRRTLLRNRLVLASQSRPVESVRL